ncbi:Transcription regulatory protein [Komagataella phaffii CBS 7435]|uniref:DM2 domain-containing protein n=2 Tax=Komagataella phaffii TaxID=460519 RepID=C4R059_KOMPG|nr:uncharacterized protein PAS_chr2-1_0821 [Komagataella phaffii GS115]AOA63088.1 GQ67_00302T0 [Komagataella phaffii]CAH2448614.1 Transcription regulatory protein [Komagataella phaffii CBS 7435]AOA67981.1 GQ68_01087T0 [Komagataella phaffii GS115]CAY68883.1 hypothetical protein PAS_chr2-1_0821 [Komagataella phaffii GS115]SCV12092.1 Transcription regulatory protein [Komagataella phaffii CBS 7435]
MNRGKPVTREPQINPQSVSFKPTDLIIPESLQEMFPEQVDLFKNLQDKEKQLDLLVNRKLLDLQDYQNNNINGVMEDSDKNEILRIFIYNISENQPWQLAKQSEDQSEEAKAIAAGSAQADPSWTLRIEGRFLNDEAADNASRKKFSSFLSSISVELFKGATKEKLDANNIIEWHDELQQIKSEIEREEQQFDGLDIKRVGSSIPGNPTEEVSCQILIQPKMYPIKLSILSKDLVELLGTNEITQHDCFVKLFNYIQVNDLFQFDQDKNLQQQQNSILIKSDDALLKIFQLEKFNVPQMLDIISTRLLKPVEPIKLNYTVNTLTNSTLGDMIIDLKINSDLLNKSSAGGANKSVSDLINELMNNQANSIEVNKLNENISLTLQLLNYNKIKYDFYKKFSEDPVKFLQKINDKNHEFLKIICSDSVGYNTNEYIDEEIFRKSEYYKDNIISEQVNLLLSSGRL